MTTATITAAEPTRAERWIQQRVGSMRELRTDRSGYAAMLRDAFVEKFGFAVLTARAVAELVGLVGEDAQIVEVGAGSGYWASELYAAGLDVRPTDPGHMDAMWSGLRPNEYGYVEGLTGVEAVEEYGPGFTLMMVWPAMDSWPADTLEAYRGDEVILCGEPRGGCTGTTRLFDILKAGWDEVGHIGIPTFPMVHDSITVWRRRGSAEGC